MICTTNQPVVSWHGLISIQAQQMLHTSIRNIIIQTCFPTPPEPVLQPNSSRPGPIKEKHLVPRIAKMPMKVAETLSANHTLSYLSHLTSK